MAAAIASVIILVVLAAQTLGSPPAPVSVLRAAADLLGYAAGVLVALAFIEGMGYATSAGGAFFMAATAVLGNVAVAHRTTMPEQSA